MSENTHAVSGFDSMPSTAPESNAVTGGKVTDSLDLTLHAVPLFILDWNRVGIHVLGITNRLLHRIHDLFSGVGLL